MSVFGASPQTTPPTTAPPTPAVFSTPFGSSFFNPPDFAQQQSQHSPRHTSNSPVFQPRGRHVFGGPAVFPVSSSGTAVFGAQDIMPGVAPSVSTTSVLPSAVEPPPFRAPLFGAASSFSAASMAATPNSGLTPTSATHTTTSSTSATAAAPPNCVFPSSVFQEATHSGNPHKTPRPVAFGMQEGGGGVLNTTPFSQPYAAASTVPFARREQSPQAFDPMTVGPKRGRGGVFAGGRGAGRARGVPPISVTPPAEKMGVQQQPLPQLKRPSMFTMDSNSRPPPQQQQQRQEQQPTVTVTAKDQLLSTRVFAAFLGKIVDDDEAIRESAAEFFEDAFFGVVGNHGGGAEFSTALQQMLTVWQTMKKKQPHFTLKGEHWVALFALGCHLNFVTSTILAGEAEQRASGAEQRSFILQNKWAALTNICTHANLMCDISLQLFSNQSENRVPYSVLPFILRRVRNTFELANDEGVLSVQSNMKATLLKLHRYVRSPSLQREPRSVVERQRAAAFACVLGEMMLYCCVPADSVQFIASFHQHCSSMVEIRSTLYHHHANNLLQEPLTDGVIEQAMELLARAFVIVPEDAKENKRLLFVKLSACGLALGRVPSPEEVEAYDVTELEDLIVAVQSSNLQLFNIAMRNNSEFYVQCGIHNVLQVVGKRIALLMVVKYYASNLSVRLDVQDMIDYYNLPLSLHEGCHVWLLPLLVERRINGVMESGVLVLSSANPFDQYGKEALVALDARERGN